MAKKNVPVSDAAGPLVYVGPNIPGGLLLRFQVFRGGVPPYLKDLRAKVPDIEKLFVPVAKLEAYRDKIATAGTNEARLYGAVQSAVQEVK